MKTVRMLLAITLLLLFQGIASAVTVRDAVFKTKNAGNVVFSHTEHLKVGDISRNCRACHDEIFSLKKKVPHSMAEMEKGKSCGACHDGRRAFPLKECLRCHHVKELHFEDKRFGKLDFSHRKHMESQTCTDCHSALYKTSRSRTKITMKEMEKGKSCGACHDGRQAFPLKDCLRCHHVKEIVFEEKSTGNIRFSHKSHMVSYGCADCHPAIYKAAHSRINVSMTEMEKGRSCGSCHDGKTAFTVKENCETCHKP